MNDPGLHSPIEDGAQAVEEDQDSERKQEAIQREDEQTFLKPRFCSLSAYTCTTNIAAVGGGLLPLPFPYWLYVYCSGQLDDAAYVLERGPSGQWPVVSRCALCSTNGEQ